MDDELAEAIVAVLLPPNTARQWFDLVNRTYREARDSGFGADLARYRQQLSTAAAEEFLDLRLVTEFTDYLAGNGGMPLLARMCALGTELAQRYELLLAEHRKSAAVPTDAEVLAPTSWQRLVARHGPDWSGWDGSDVGWVQYRDWFYTVANGFDREVYAEAYYRLDPLNAVEPAERIDALRELGFTITAIAPAPVEAPAPAKPGLGARLLGGIRRGKSS